MKRGWKWLLVAALLAVAGGAAWMFLRPREAPEESKQSAVEECSRESEFLVTLTAPASQVIDAPEPELTANGFGCDAYGSDGVENIVSGYPGVLDSYHLTEVRVESDACAVYGIRVGDTAESAEECLICWGYESADPMVCDCAYRKHNVLIEFSLDVSRKVSLIRVAVNVTNEENVVF